MEQTQRRYEADRDDLLRRVMGLDSGLVNLDQVHGEGVLGLERVSVLFHFIALKFTEA